MARLGCGGLWDYPPFWRVKLQTYAGDSCGRVRGTACRYGGGPAGHRHQVMSLPQARPATAPDPSDSRGSGRSRQVMPHPDGGPDGEPDPAEEGALITAYPDGPYLVRGTFRIVDEQGNELEVARRTVALCRCGCSRIKPWCDGTHKLVGPRRRPPALAQSPSPAQAPAGADGAASEENAPHSE